MRDFLLLILAMLLFSLLSLVGVVYTAIYFMFNEKEKNRTYAFHIAYSIDVFANMCFGEFFEAIFCIKRGRTSFGEKVTLSAAMGEQIFLQNFKKNKMWFSRLLDWFFREKDHCLIAYEKEILKFDINN